jgi:hypothetical protein
LGDVDVDAVLEALDLREDLLLAGLELGALDIVLRLHHHHGVLLVGNRVLRFGLNDFAFHLADLGFLLAIGQPQINAEMGIIEHEFRRTERLFYLFRDVLQHEL